MQRFVAYKFLEEDEIRLVGEEIYLAPSREAALEYALYYHRLHDRKAYLSPRGVVRCRFCKAALLIPLK